MTMLRISHTVASTTAEGPGNRFALWVQGCTIRCPGCCNPHLFNPRGGHDIALDDLMAKIMASDVEGISVLGGEPMQQAKPLAELAARVKSAGRSVMVYSGYLYEDLLLDPDTKSVLGSTDILVDGQYERDKPETTRRWIGSRNQRVHFLSDRYTMDDQWRRPNEVVVRLTRKGLDIHGWPGVDITMGKR